MVKPLSYLSVFVSIHDIGNASFKAKNIQAGSPDVFMSMAKSSANQLKTYGNV